MSEDGVLKSAILLMSIGEEEAAEVLKYLGPKEVQKIGMAMAGLDNISREQIQVQLSFPHHRKWFDVFAGWWEDGFRLWRRRSSPDAVLNFLCELGPAEYAITGADGYELSDRWQEALIMKRRVESIWASLEGEPIAGPASPA